MDTTISATELSRRMSDILNRIKYRGERFIVQRNGEPIAVIQPLQDTPGITARELIAPVGNLEFPGDGFGDALEAVQTSQPFTETRGTTWGEFTAKVDDLQLPGDGFADDLEGIQAAQGIAEVPEWPD
jgi:prevent-host-death family protein